MWAERSADSFDIPNSFNDFAFVWTICDKDPVLPTGSPAFRRSQTPKIIGFVEGHVQRDAFTMGGMKITLLYIRKSNEIQVFRFYENPIQKHCSAQGNQTNFSLISLRRTRFLHGIDQIRRGFAPECSMGLVNRILNG